MNRVLGGGYRMRWKRENGRKGSLGGDVIPNM
jgi:hypothetical protein